MKKALLHLVSSLYIGLSRLIPVKKEYYAFYPLHDLSKLSGNIRAMVLYIRDNHKEIKPVIITKSKMIKKEAEQLGIKSTMPFFGFSWTLLRAKFLFLDSNWFPRLLSPKLSIIQLWHGVGFKNIALMDDNLTKEEKEKFEYYYRKYALLISSSEADLKKKEASFHSSKIAITGSPRNDIFFSAPERFEEIKKKYNLNSYSSIITYAPTFRDFETTAPFSAQFWKPFQEYLEKTNQLFAVKKHPLDRYLKIPSGFPNIIDFSNAISDTQELLLITDVLISDYSSISTDFALTGKPIISFLYDFESYKQNCRSIYYDLEEILPKPFVSTEEELLDKIMHQNWTEKVENKESYTRFIDLFHKYTDGNSCRRVMKDVLTLNHS